MTEKTQLNPLLKLLFDLGPLVLFFIANSRPELFAPLLAPFLPPDLAKSGIFAATAVFMVAVVAALVASYVLIRRWPVMPIVSASCCASRCSPWCSTPCSISPTRAGAS